VRIKFDIYVFIPVHRPFSFTSKGISFLAAQYILFTRATSTKLTIVNQDKFITKKIHRMDRLLWKEDLSYSDDQPFPLIPQTPLITFRSLKIIDHKKDHMTCDVGNSYPDLGQVQKCGWVIICCTPFIVLKMYDKMYCVNTGHTQSYTSQYS
jgi:hypothetical protein